MILQCPNCGKEIESTMSACPHCSMSFGSFCEIESTDVFPDNKPVDRVVDLNANIVNIINSITPSKSGVVANIRFTNATDKDIVAIKFNARATNSFGEVVEVAGKEEFQLLIQDIRVEAFKESTIYKVNINNSTIRELQLREAQIRFFDGEVADYKGEHLIYVPYRELLANTVTHQDVVQGLNSSLNFKAKYHPWQNNDVWLCTCGRCMSHDQSECSYCHNTKDQFKLFDQNDLAQKASQLQLNRIVAKIKEEQAHKQQQELLRQQEETARIVKEAKRKKTIKRTIITAIVLLVVGAMSSGAYWYWKTNYYYSPEELAHIEKVINLIDKAPGVRTNRAFNISNVQEAYDTLTDREKLKVTNYQLLVDTMAQIEAEEKAKRDQAVKDAITRIDEIGEVTFDRATNDRIEKAKRAFGLVAEEDLEKVTNQSILIEAQEKYEPWLTQLRNSKTSFSVAEKYEQNKNYEKAIEQYKKVIVEDDDYYELAQKKIAELEAQIRADQQAQAAAQAKAQQEAVAKAQAQMNTKCKQVAPILKAMKKIYKFDYSQVSQCRTNSNYSLMACTINGVRYIATNDTSMSLALMPFFNTRVDFNLLYDFANMNDHKDRMTTSELNSLWDSIISNTAAVDVQTVLSYVQ